MVFLKYVGVFVGVFLLVGLVTALIIGGPYFGAIGFIVSIVAVIYYRGRRRIRAAEDEFVETFTDAYVAESKKLDAASKLRRSTEQTRFTKPTARPNITRKQQTGIPRIKKCWCEHHERYHGGDNCTLCEKAFLAGQFNSALEYMKGKPCPQCINCGLSHPLHYSQDGNTICSHCAARLVPYELRANHAFTPKNSTLSNICIECLHRQRFFGPSIDQCENCGARLILFICPQCETENSTDAKFCEGCGEERREHFFI